MLVATTDTSTHFSFSFVCFCLGDCRRFQHTWSDCSFSTCPFFFCLLYSYESRFLGSTANFKMCFFLLSNNHPWNTCQSLIIPSSYVLPFLSYLMSAVPSLAFTTFYFLLVQCISMVVFWISKQVQLSLSLECY